MPARNTSAAALARNLSRGIPPKAGKSQKLVIEKREEVLKNEKKAPPNKIESHYEKEKEAFSNHIRLSMLPIQLLMRATGRYPLKILKNAEQGKENFFEFSLRSPDGVYFIFVSILTLYILIMVTFNLLDTFLNITFGNGSTRTQRCHTERLFELVMFDRYLLGSVVLWTAFCHILLGSATLLIKRDYISEFFSIWTTIAYKIHMDIAYKLYQSTLTDLLIFLGSVILLVIMTILRLTATVAGQTSFFSLLLFRLYNPCMLNRYTDYFTFGSFYYTANVLGSFLFFFVFVASKCFVFLFLFLCRMIKHSFASWNGRFFAAMLYSDEAKVTPHTWGRTTHDLLFQDHCHLLDLLRLTDDFFSPNIESYYALQLVSIIFECYAVLRFAKYGGDKAAMTADKFFLRKLDWVPGILILLVNLFLLTLVLKASAEVEEEAMLGLEIIRRKTMLGSKTDKEKDFVLSMFYSYTNYGRVGLCGGGYFRFDNELIITICSLFFSCFIVTYQFQPLLDYDYAVDTYNRINHFKWYGMTQFLGESDWLSKRREDIGAFVRDLEGKNDRHWLAEDEPITATNSLANVPCIFLPQTAKPCPLV